jgi:hypothetical protein
MRFLPPIHRDSPTPSDSHLIALCEQIQANFSSLVKATWFFGFAVSFLERQSETLLRSLGIPAWPLTQTVSLMLPPYMNWRSEHVLHDLLNAYFCFCSFIMAPAFFACIVMVGYPLLLWAGAGVAVAWLHPRFTPYPNLDRVLWPALAALPQALLVRSWLRRLARRGRPALANQIRYFYGELAIAVGAVVVLVQLIPLLAYFASVLLQLAAHWLFQTR